VGVIAFPMLYIFELAVSFLPYIVAVHVFLAGYWLSKLFFVDNKTKYIVLIGLHIV